MSNPKLTPKKKKKKKAGLPLHFVNKQRQAVSGKKNNIQTRVTFWFLITSDVNSLVKGTNKTNKNKIKQVLQAMSNSTDHVRCIFENALHHGDLKQVKKCVEIEIPVDVNRSFYPDQKKDVGPHFFSYELPLHIAVACNHLAISRYLLHHGADVEKVDSRGFTALHVAIHCRRRDIAIFLMREGNANLYARTHQGHLPIDLAVTEELRQIILDEEERRRNGIHGESKA